RDSFSDLALDNEDVSQLPVVRICPQVRIILSVNQLHIDSHLVGRFLHASLENVRYTKLFCDLTEIARLTVIKLCGSARNYFQVSDLSQPREDLFLNAFSEITIVGVAA